MSASSASAWARMEAGEGPPSPERALTEASGSSSAAPPGSAERLPLRGGEIPERTPGQRQLLQQLAGAPVGLAERHPGLHERLGQIGRIQALVLASGAHRVRVEPDRRHRAGERGQHQLERAGRIEGRLLVLLEVAVIAEGQALEQRGHA